MKKIASFVMLCAVALWMCSVPLTSTADTQSDSLLADLEAAASNLRRNAPNSLEHGNAELTLARTLGYAGKHAEANLVLSAFAPNGPFASCPAAPTARMRQGLEMLHLGDREGAEDLFWTLSSSAETSVALESIQNLVFLGILLEEQADLDLCSEALGNLVSVLDEKNRKKATRFQAALAAIQSTDPPSDATALFAKGKVLAQACDLGVAIGLLDEGRRCRAQACDAYQAFIADGPPLSDSVGAEDFRDRVLARWLLARQEFYDRDFEAAQVLVDEIHALRSDVYKRKNLREAADGA